MPWNTSPIFVTGAVLTSGQLNNAIGSGGNIDQTPTNLVTTAGDITYATGSKAMTRLGIGINGKVLTVIAGVPGWTDTALSSIGLYGIGNLTLNDGNGGNPVASTGALRLNNNSGIYARNAANTANLMLVASGAADQIGVGDLTNGAGLNLDVKTGAEIFMRANGTTFIQAGATRLIPLTDNAVALGQSGQRWTACWAVNGTIQTSSEKAKRDFADLPGPLALRVARSTRIYSFKYNGDDPLLSDLLHVGFKAEEAHPLLTLGGKLMASPQSTACLALAAVAELSHKLDDLKEMVRERR